MKLLIPMYGYPTISQPLWTGVAEAGALATAIIDPASGPTNVPNSDYVTACTRLRDAGVKMLGYVNAGYCQRPVDQALADINIWRGAWGPWIKGIFVDQAASIPSYFAAIQRAAQAANLSVTLNAGTVMPAHMLQYCDAAVMFEGPRAAWQPDLLPAHVAGHAAIIHTAPVLGSLVDDAKRLGLGYLYVTNDSGANSYDTLPSYWSELVAAVRGISAPPVPLPGGIIEDRLARIEKAIAALVAAWND